MAAGGQQLLLLLGPLQLLGVVVGLPGARMALVSVVWLDVALLV